MFTCKNWTTWLKQTRTSSGVSVKQQVEGFANWALIVWEVCGLNPSTCPVLSGEWVVSDYVHCSAVLFRWLFRWRIGYACLLSASFLQVTAILPWCLLVTIVSATQTPYTRGWSPWVVRHPHQTVNVMDGCRRQILYKLTLITGFTAFGFWRTVVFPVPFLWWTLQNTNSCSDLTILKCERKCLIIMLLLLSGIQPNPDYI